MEKLPADVCLHIFCWLDHQNLATAQQVCQKWKSLGSNNDLWRNLFKDRWGEDAAAFFAPIPIDSKSWKHVYEVQDRCDRVGLGLKIIREGSDYYLVHQGQIQRYLGSKNAVENVRVEGESSIGNCSIYDKILFFIGDLETDAKRARTH
ncbi:uncharacterized protein [Euphorbia lathyris]|uniref:uncharacterized protein n=1 Tax=Euphorbia lathyris TaxID=212925 RepID=UPI0033139447